MNDPGKKKERASRKDEFDTPEYHQLVENIKRVIDEAQAQGVNFGDRYDFLTCKACGAYENELFSGEQVICAKDDRQISAGRFILIDSKERGYRRNKKVYYKTTYAFICPVCGAQQEEVFRDVFER